MTKEALAVTATFLVRTFAQQVSVWCKGQKMVKFKIQDLNLVPAPGGGQLALSEARKPDFLARGSNFS